MREWALEYIACPMCGAQFYCEHTILQADNVIEGTLTCKSKAHKFTIHNGIPRLVSENLNKVDKRTACSFAYQWEHLAFHEDENEKEFLSYLEPVGLMAGSFREQIVFDAGCGMGKFSFLAAKYGARYVIGMDFSDSVEVAQKLTSSLSNVQIIQGDLRFPPLKQKTFSLIFCIGVLHHLPEPKRSFMGLSPFLSSGGILYSWVYAKEGNWLYILFADPLRRWLTSRLPQAMNDMASRAVAAFLWCLMKMVYVPLARVGLEKILPMSEYFLYFNKRGFSIFRGTVLDKMIPPISYYIKENEFAGWYKETGLTGVKIAFRNGNSWCGAGKRGNF